jgi:hypothetical protein
MLTRCSPALLCLNPSQTHRDRILSGLSRIPQDFLVSCFYPTPIQEGSFFMVKRLLLVVSQVVAGLAGPLASAQTQVTIGAMKDNTLYESTTGALSNGAGQHFFAGKTNRNEIRRGLIAFDIASNVPANSIITNVTLALSMSQTASGVQTISLHRATADWGEGVSIAGGNQGGGAPATMGDATWLHRFFNTTFWTAQGGDFVATLSASQSVSVIGSYSWGSTAGMVSDVQEWLSNPASNFGWVVLGNEGATLTAKRFDSRENENPNFRPRLLVTYQTVTSAGETQTGPGTFSLLQNYPNPFNPSTKILFEVPESGFVALKVFNLFGQEVATLVDEQKTVGSHEVVFDATQLPSGVYFYRLRAGSFADSKKLVLLR